MKTYHVTISYIDNCRPLVFECDVPIFAAGVDFEPSARGYAYMRFRQIIKLPFSRIHSVEVFEK